MNKLVYNHLCQKENGWYIALVETRKTHECKEILCLWRDGVWVAQLYGMDVIAYDPVMVMRDTYKHPTIYMEGAVKLAATITGGKDVCMITKRTEEEIRRIDQLAKADEGKPRLTLVPRQILYEIAKVREYGVEKYPDGGEDNWKQVSAERYRNAAFRHFLAYLDNPYGTDMESGLTHLAHLACNIAFLCELQKEDIWIER